MLTISIRHNHIFLEYLSMKVTKYLASSMVVVFMGSHMSECTIYKVLVARLHPCSKMPPYVIYLQCMLCKTTRMWDNFFLPRFMALTMFWSVWTSFMFKWLRQRCQTPNTPSPIRNCTKLATSTMYTFVKFTLYKFSSCDTIVMASPSQTFIKHLFKLNCTFKSLPRENWLANWTHAVHLWYEFV